ncbi:MAG: DUF1684 domain-containing protein [Candidatus Eisenbacteria bacterium]
MKKLSFWAVALMFAASTAGASVRISDLDDSGINVNRIVKKVPAAKPVTLAPAEAETLTKLILKERSDSEIWLQTSPTSYLAAIARRDIGDRRTLSVGSDGSNEVRLDDPAVLTRHLRITVVGDSFRVESLDPAATFVVSGDSLRSAVLAPGTIRVGRFTLRLSHQRYPAVIVFDPQSPRFAEYKGLRWFPVDLRMRFAAPLTANPEPDTVYITSTHSEPRQALRAGWFVLSVGGKRSVLEATRLIEPGVGENALSVFFRDGTTGKDSYEVGRYLDPERRDDGTYVLDFNNAYNPACAVSPHYNCPIPPKFNKLKVAIRAGEMDHKYVK